MRQLYFGNLMFESLRLCFRTPCTANVFSCLIVHSTLFPSSGVARVGGRVADSIAAIHQSGSSNLALVL